MDRTEKLANRIAMLTDSPRIADLLDELVQEATREAHQGLLAELIEDGSITEDGVQFVLANTMATDPR